MAGVNWGALQYWSDTITPALSYILNFTLLYLIKKHTTKEMRPYTKVLYQGIFIDLFLATTIFFTKQHITLVAGTLGLRVTDFFENTPNPWNFLLNLSNCLAYLFLFMSLPVPFYYRYMLICKNKQISNKTLLLLYALTGVIILVYLILFGWAFVSDASKTQEMVNYLVTKLQFPNATYIISSVQNPILIVDLSLILLTNCAYYTLIIYASWRIWKFLKENNGKMSQNSKNVHRTLNFILLFQALVPILCFMPLLVGLVSLFFKWEIVGLGSICMVMTTWLTIINPFSTILLVKPYRNRVMCRKVNETKISVISKVVV